jgi:hypothetical protein
MTIVPVVCVRKWLRTCVSSMSISLPQITHEGHDDAKVGLGLDGIDQRSLLTFAILPPGIWTLVAKELS